MFPVQLMTVRKSRDGKARSIFLTEENSDYCHAVLELFGSSIGRSMEEIEKEIKVLELKVQNPKIIRGLALIMFRISKLSPPAHLDPELVRSTIFKHARLPAVSRESRDEILQKVAKELNSSPGEVEKSMYADKENEQVLESIPQISNDDLAKKFNMEQIETVILKSSTINLRMAGDMNRIIRRIRSLGLLYTIENESGQEFLKISGPLSIKEHSDRYGYKFALLIRFIMRFDAWELDAKVMLKSADKKSEYVYHIDDSTREYVDARELNPEGLNTSNFNFNPEPLHINGSTVFPDYSVEIDGENISILVTRPGYYEDDFSVLSGIRKAGFRAELFCIVDPGEKCPKGAKCMKGKFSFTDVYELLQKKGSVEKKKAGTFARATPTDEKRPKKDLNEEVVKHLNSLFPDSDAMVDYLDFMGFPPAETLEKAGFQLKWHGLRIEVRR